MLYICVLEKTTPFLQTHNICLAGQEPRSLLGNGDFNSVFTTARHWAYSKQDDSRLQA